MTKKKRDIKSEELETTETEKKKEEEKIIEYVFLMKNEKAVLTPVITGIQDNNYIFIKSGVMVDDEIITGPYKVVSKTLKNKTPVEKVEKDDLFTEKEE